LRTTAFPTCRLTVIPSRTRAPGSRSPRPATSTAKLSLSTRRPCRATCRNSSGRRRRSPRPKAPVELPTATSTRGSQPGVGVPCYDAASRSRALLVSCSARGSHVHVGNARDSADRFASSTTPFGDFCFGTADEQVKVAAPPPLVNVSLPPRDTPRPPSSLVTSATTPVVDFLPEASHPRWFPKMAGSKPPRQIQTP
jgi:hypothetical protein